MDGMRKITIGGGPLKGKTVEVAAGTETFTTHAGDGHYEVTETGARWHGRPAATEKPAPTAKRRKPKAPETVETTAPADAPTESLAD